MKRVEVCQVLTKGYVDKDVTVCGWIRTSRDSKNMAFIEINDGSDFENLQIVADKNIITNFGEVSRMGSAIKVSGKCVRAANNADGVEVEAKTIELLGDCPPEYPLQKKRHTLEFLRTMPHLRLRTNTFNAVFRVRSVLSNAIHNFFQSKGFIYSHTPIITGSDCEGAGEVFSVTTNGYAPKYKSEEEYYANDFFSTRAGLTVSGQLEGEACAMAFGKIYTFGPTFRAENSNTPRHAAEFWQIEPEIAFADLGDVIALAEDMFKSIVSETIKKCPKEMQFFEKHYESGLLQKLASAISNDFAVCDYTDAIDILIKSGVEFSYPVKWGLDLQTEHERYIAEKHFNKPVFITNYPKEIKSFYMKQNADGKTVAASDLLVPGVGEIIGSSEREADYGKLLEVIKQRGMRLSDYENYLDLRRFGSCPHGGFGLGLERLLMYITGISNIRDVALYPRSVGQLF